MAYSYTTPSLIEAELRATSAFSGSTVPSLSQVTTWIAEESEQLNHDYGSVIGQLANTVDIDYLGGESILLKNSPVISISSLLYSTTDLGNSSYPTWKSLTENTHYSLYKDSGEIILLLENFMPNIGRKKFRCVYTSGNASTPLTIQKLATKVVAQRVLNTLISSNIEDGNDGGSISVGSISIVEPASYGVNSYKTLNEEITRLKDELVKGFGVYRYNIG